MFLSKSTFSKFNDSIGLVISNLKKNIKGAVANSISGIIIDSFYIL